MMADAALVADDFGKAGPSSTGRIADILERIAVQLL